MDKDQIREICAISAQETIRAYDILLGIVNSHWDDALQWEKDIINQWVSGLCTFSLDSQQMHTIWYDGMIAEGWGYDDTYNKNNKKHPYLIEFQNLSFEYQLRYNMLRHIISGVWTSLG